jgi:hypothetical protein
MGLEDNLRQTAEVLNDAVATGLMTAEEAAHQMQEAMDGIAASANLSGIEEMVLRSITDQLAGSLSSATINMDVYISRLAGVTKGSYEAAIASVEMQRAFSAGVFGEDSAVTAGLDATIASLRTMQQEAIYAAATLDKAFAGPSTTSQEGDRPTGGGAAEEVKPAQDIAEKWAEIRAIREEIAAQAQQLIEKEDAHLASIRADREAEVAHRNAVQAKLSATQSEQEAAQGRVNDQLLSGAQEFGRIMLSGKENWEEEMLKAIIKLGIEMGLNMILPGLGSFVSGILPFSTGGTVRHAAAGTTVPDAGAYGDRHPYLLERGEVVLSRQQVLQDRATPQRSVSLSLSIGSMFSSASKTDLLRSADVMIQAFRERGIQLG